MEALERKLGSYVILELRGRVDEFNTSVLRDELDTLINTGKFFIIIDLSRSDFLAAHCMNAIWAAKRRARTFGGEIVLCGANGAVRETIRFVDLQKVLHCSEDIIEAACVLEEQENFRASGQTAPSEPEFAEQSFLQIVGQVINKFRRAA